MTRDEVRKLADLAGWTPTALAMATEAEWARLERFAELIHGYVVHEEREACAKVCESRIMGDNNREDAEAKRCAEYIRARSSA